MRLHPALAAFLCGCVTLAPFEDREVLWHDPDDGPTPVPEKQEPSDLWARGFQPMVDELDRFLGLEGRAEAVNVNALDEVPDSTWFTNRWYVSVAQVATGTTPIADPVMPLTVIKGKENGATAGFVVRDAKGVKYVIKLDPSPGIGSGPDAVGARLLHAMGYNVPADSVVEFTRDDLTLALDATMPDPRLGTVSLTPRRLDGLLAKGTRLADGKWRALASRYIEGRILGPWSYLGVREDDPNDRVRHESRRELRGLSVIAAWINDVDTLDSNTLDTYVGKPGHGHVVHYLIDFGSSFGSFAVGPMAGWMGEEGYFDPAAMLAATAAFGIGAHKPWMSESARARRAEEMRRWPELGGFTEADFDPASWSPLWRNPAFARATARDRFWGAKLVARIDGPKLRAAIAAGKYSDGAAARLYEILRARREKVLRWAFAAVAPLDELAIVHGRLCWSDLWLREGYDDPSATRYLVDGKPVPATGSRTCVAIAQSSGVHHVGIKVLRRPGDKPGPELRAWFADGQRLVGLERDAR